jgi:serine protease inhibitor
MWPTPKKKISIFRRRRKSVKLMHMNKAKFKYGVNQKLSTQAIELPYVGSRLSMIVLLPDASSSLQKLEAALTVDHLFKRQ